MTFDAIGIGWIMADASLRALAVAIAVAMLLRVLRIDTAAVRHSAWTGVLAGMLFMPVLPQIVPVTLPLTLPVPDGAATWLDTGGQPEGPDFRGGEGATAAPEPASASATAGPAPARSSTARRATSGSLNPASGPWLPTLLLSCYLAGVAAMGTRLVCGWWLAAAMIRRARRHGTLDLDVPATVCQSSEVVVPITAGVLRPVIILPAQWRTWEPETLAAILAHEAAHVRRHDAAITLVAHLNRVIFWFHPLAWWLERTLATTAEHTCDDAAARAVAAPARYAQILVGMADVVRRNGGRLTWQAVGVHGAGLLDSRIDRLLRGNAFGVASRRQRIAAALGCTLLLALVVACRGERAAPPLREDPELAKRLVAQDEQRKSYEAARDMSQAQADTLEQRLVTNPDDFDARRQLVTYYTASRNVAWDKKVPGLRRHALWLIQHHPEHEISPPSLSPQFDPEGFAAAKALWDAHLARPGVSPFLVYRAASFFAPYHKPYAEQLIQRGMAMDPESVALKARMPADRAGYQWPAQLASLYAAALRGSPSVWGTGEELRTHLEGLQSPFAQHVRMTMERTSDARLLARVGALLVWPVQPTRDPALKQAFAEVRAQGVRYLERALELEPGLTSAKSTLVRMRLAERMTDADRLANRSFEGYVIAEDIAEYAKKDAAGGKQQRDEASARAEEVLKIAAAHAGDPAYSAAVMTAHHVLATAALRDGDRDRAVQHLRDSVKVPPSEQLQYAPPFSWSRVVNRLLKLGERERVAEFLEAFAALTVTDRERLLADAKAVREGRMPSSYQHMVAREGQ